MMKKLFLVLMICLSLGSCRQFHKWNADFVNDNRQEYLVQDAQKRIASYEWFYAQYSAIEATKQKVIIAKDTPEEKGIRMVLESMIAEYNAKSRMTTTQGLWKAQDLPYQLSSKGE